MGFGLDAEDILSLILSKILDYLAEHAEEIIDAIKEQFGIAETDSEVKLALNELAYAPSKENLDRLTSVLKSRGQDTSKLADILVSKTITI